MSRRIAVVLCVLLGGVILAWGGRSLLDRRASHPAASGDSPGILEAGEGEQDDKADGESQLRAVIETGVLYVYGHRLDPPFVFTMVDDSLFINGIRISPTLGRGPAPLPREIPQVYRDHRALHERAWAEGRRLLDQGTSREAAARAMAGVYRSSLLVDSVKVNGEELVVRWAGDPYPEHVSMPEYPLWPGPTREEVFRKIVRREQSSARLGRAAFYGDNYRVSVDADEAETLLRILRETGDPDAEGLSVLKGKPARDLLDPLPLPAK